MKKAVIFDLDDTLITEEDGEIRAIKPMKELSTRFHERKEYISIILTARAENIRSETRELLERHGIKFDILYMRPEDRFEVLDEKFKQEAYQKILRTGLDVKLAIDDQQKVVNMWRKQDGLSCIQLPEKRKHKNKRIRAFRRIYDKMPRMLQKAYLKAYKKKHERKLS